VAPYWDAQLGLRHDTSEGGQARNWLALGIDGLAPYWFEVGVTAYLGEGGRTALGLSVEQDLLLTQRLVLQPRLEAQAHGRRDAVNGIGKGLSDATVGLRLRYEFSRQFAPYLGLEWAGHFGETADLRRAADEPVRETRAVAGLRFWF
jgi:copper resistance protein B